MVQCHAKEFMLGPATKPLNVDMAGDDCPNKTSDWHLSCLTESVLQAHETFRTKINSFVSAFRCENFDRPSACRARPDASFEATSGAVQAFAYRNE